MLADYYVLNPTTTAYHDWSACQYHQPQSGSGFALFFRRHESRFPTFESALQALDQQASYTVVLCEGYDETSRATMSGQDLANMAVTIQDCPGSLLIEYSLKPS